MHVQGSWMAIEPVHGRRTSAGWELDWDTRPGVSLGGFKGS